jgi:hypothetical protein
MAIVEFIGPSGIGKSWLLHTILQGSAPREWRTLQEVARNRQIAPRFNHWEVFLLDRKLRAVLATRGIGVVDIYRILPFFFNLLAVDSVLRSEFKTRKIVDDDPLFNNYAGAIIELAQRNQAAFAELVSNRAFVFLRSHPERILSNIRARQARGQYRVAVEGVSESDLMATVREQVERFQQLRDLVAVSGNPFIEIELEPSVPGHERPVVEFIDRALRSVDASVPSAATWSARTDPTPPGPAA